MHGLYTYPLYNYNFTAAQVDAAIAKTVACGLDTVVMQALCGYAEYYNTTLLPKSSVVTVSYDPLQYMLDQAAAAGLSVWVYWPCGCAPEFSAWRAMWPDADWQLGYVTGGTYRWLNFSNSDVRTYVAQVVSELFTNYSAIGGVLLDFIRYPHPSIEGLDPADYPALSKNDITTTVTLAAGTAHAAGGTLGACVYAGWESQEQCYQFWDTDWITTGSCDIYMPMAIVDNSSSGTSILAHYITDWDATAGSAPIWPILYFKYDTVKTVAEMTTEVGLVRGGGYGTSHMAWFRDTECDSTMATYIASLPWVDDEGGTVTPTTINFGAVVSSLALGPLQTFRANSAGDGFEAFTPGGGSAESTDVDIHAINTVTTDTTVTSDYATILVDATYNDVTLTLPSASLHTGRKYVIKRIDSSAYVVTIDGYGSELVDGATTQKLSFQNDCMTIQSDGTKWVLLSYMQYGSSTSETYTISARVAGTADDASCYGGTLYPTSNTLTIGNNGYSTQRSAIRVALPVPRGVTVNSAKITFTAFLGNTIDGVNVRFSYQNADSPANFGTPETNATFMARSAGTTVVDWGPFNDDWVVDSEYDSPDLTTLFQALFNEPFWNSGDYAVILIDDLTGGGSGKERRPYSYDQSTTKAALVTLTYTETGVSSNTRAKAWASGTAINSTAQTIIANGDGDVTKGITFQYLANNVAGSAVDGGIAILSPGGSATLLADGTNTLTLSCGTAGDVTVQRTAGTTDTFHVSSYMVWR